MPQGDFHGLLINTLQKARTQSLVNGYRCFQYSAGQSFKFMPHKSTWHCFRVFVFRAFVIEYESRNHERRKHEETARPWTTPLTKSVVETPRRLPWSFSTHSPSRP